MEVKNRITGAWLGKMAVFLLFVVLMVARAQAQANVSVSPSNTNVSNGDTVTFNATGYIALGVLTSATWSFSGGTWPTNATVTTTGGGILNVDSTINSTLTIRNFSSACAGTYTFTITGGVLLIVNASQSATVSLTPTINAMPTGSQMLTKGFKIQFSAPTGSNLVIQASSDLKNWTSLCTNVVTGGSVTYTDLVAKTVSERFYRAKLK